MDFQSQLDAVVQQKEEWTQDLCHDLDAVRSAYAALWAEKELLKLVRELKLRIKPGADGKKQITFGEMFDQTYNIFEALAGTLLSGKRRGVVDYICENENLLQGRDDSAPIFLLKEKHEIKGNNLTMPCLRILSMNEDQLQHMRGCDITKAEDLKQSAEKLVGEVMGYCNNGHGSIKGKIPKPEVPKINDYITGVKRFGSPKPVPAQERHRRSSAPAPVASFVSPSPKPIPIINIKEKEKKKKEKKPKSPRQPTTPNYIDNQAPSTPNFIPIQSSSNKPLNDNKNEGGKFLKGLFTKNPSKVKIKAQGQPNIQPSKKLKSSDGRPGQLCPKCDKFLPSLTIKFCGHCGIKLKG